MLQLIVVGIIATVYIFIGSWRDFISVLLGAGAWVIPSLYFIRKLFKPTNKQNSQNLLKNFITGEITKLLLSAGLIIFITLFLPIKTLSFLSGYIAAISASLLMPFYTSWSIRNENNN